MDVDIRGQHVRLYFLKNSANTTSGANALKEPYVHWEFVEFSLQ